MAAPGGGTRPSGGGPGCRIQSPRLEIGGGGIALVHERSAVANQRHRGSQGVPIVLFSAVAVFAVALTWRLTIGNQPQREGQELVFMFLALASGGTASVSALQILLRLLI